MNLQKETLEKALFSLRITVFLVMLMWTIDKFVRPSHAAAVFENFYALPGLSHAMSYLIGGVELIILLGFLVGFKKKFTYGFVFVVHAIWTISSYQQYFDPYGGKANLLFFAAWPMLAAIYTLFVLREHDKRLTLA